MKIKHKCSEKRKIQQDEVIGRTLQRHEQSIMSDIDECHSGKTKMSLVDLTE